MTLQNDYSDKHEWHYKMTILINMNDITKWLYSDKHEWHYKMTLFWYSLFFTEVVIEINSIGIVDRLYMYILMIECILCEANLYCRKILLL